MVTGTIDEAYEESPQLYATRRSQRKPMSIDAEQTAIRTVIVSALMGHFEASGRGFDALFAMRQAEAIVKALKIAGYEIKRA